MTVAVAAASQGSLIASGSTAAAGWLLAAVAGPRSKLASPGVAVEVWKLSGVGVLAWWAVSTKLSV